MIFCIQKTNILQKKKRFFSVNFRLSKISFEKFIFRRIIVKNFIAKKLKFYRQFQKTFDQIFFLIHFNNDRIFYIDIDVFKRREFEIMIYHFKFDVDFNNSKRNDIQFILFLNRMLNETKIRY